jgi:hypothetical protein
MACATPAFAQTSAADEQGVSPGVITVDSGPGTLDSPVSLLNAIELNAGEEGTNGAIRLSGVIRGTGGRLHTFGLTAGAPLDKDSGTAFSALDPFAGGVFLEGKYTFTQLIGRRTDGGSAALALCNQLRSAGLEMNIQNGECNTAFIREHAPSRADEFEHTLLTNATVLFGGLTGRVGRDDYKFLDPLTGVQAQDHRTPWSVGAFFGVSYLPWHSSFSIDFRHQTRFKAATTAAVCPGTPGVVVCPVGPVGPPGEREQNILSGEYRQRLGRSFAFSIRASYDFEADIFQLDVPAYFISDGSLGLNAGVRARYVHDPDPDDLDEGWVFGILVSKSFSLF